MTTLEKALGAFETTSLTENVAVPFLPNCAATLALLPLSFSKPTAQDDPPTATGPCATLEGRSSFYEEAQVTTIISMHTQHSHALVDTSH